MSETPTPVIYQLKGLTLAESKQLLLNIQQTLVEEQIQEYQQKRSLKIKSSDLYIPYIARVPDRGCTSSHEPSITAIL